MAWTYSGDPSSSNKDAVRFLVADTKAEEAFVTDEEIEWALLQKGTVYGACSIIAQAIATQFSTLSDEEIGPLKFKYAERAKSYSQVAARFNGLAATQQTMSIYCGGIDVADKEANKLNTSIVQPGISKGEFDLQNEILPEVI